MSPTTGQRKTELDVCFRVDTEDQKQSEEGFFQMTIKFKLNTIMSSLNVKYY